MARTVSADGTIAAAQTDDLSFASAGTVTAVNVKAGQTVKAGDVLATIDSAELQSAVADAESSVADAQAKLSDDEDAGASDAQIEADKSSLTSAQDKLASAQSDLDGAKLVATFDGTVAAVNISVGEQLGSSGTAAPVNRAARAAAETRRRRRVVHPPRTASVATATTGTAEAATTTRVRRPTSR